MKTNLQCLAFTFDVSPQSKFNKAELYDFNPTEA